MHLKLCSALVIAATALLFASCKKKPSLDSIVKDLATDNYSLSFDKTYPEFGISKTAYGSDNFLVYADPQDVICPEPSRLRFPKAKVPVYVIPKIVLPTCPTMIPWDFSEKLADLIQKADPNVFAGLKPIKVDGGKALLANDKFTAQYASLKADKMDDSVLNNLNADKYLLLMAPDKQYAGFERGFYGNANINQLAASGTAKQSGSRLKDFFRPVYIGCFDPEIMTVLKSKLELINPQVFKSLQINQVQENARAATLSFQ